MSRFPSVQASVAEPFFSAVPLSLSRVETLAEECGLPGGIVSQPEGIISLHAAEKFMFRLDQTLRHDVFFIESLRTSQSSRMKSVANIRLPYALTGLDAITAVAERISSILYGAGFLIEKDGSRIWLLRTAGTTEWTDNWPVQQYNLEVALRVLEGALGQPLTPVALRLRRAVDRDALPAHYQGLPQQLSKTTMGLAFAVDDLLPPAGGVFVSDAEERGAGADHETTVSALQRCLETYLPTTAPKALTHVMSRAFGMSPRTYRRHLEHLGVSHRQLVSNARLTRAERMLANPDIPITEIAFELGYAYSPAFTRFFQSRVGITPQTYRRRMMQ